MSEGEEGKMSLAEALLDLAQHPERIRELEDVERGDRLGLLEGWYPGAFSGGRRELLESGLKQIRLRIEADVAASNPHTHSITFTIITF